MKFLDLNGLSQLVTFGNNSYVSSVIYDSTNHVINFKNANGNVINSIDASNFIKDGMVSSVTIDTPETGPNVGKSCLIVTFNTDSGKDPIEIPIENIFSSENYYTKTEIDNQLDDKQDTLVSGTNIKTINNQSLVGSGNINITADGCEVVSNKVTSLSSSSTDTQYPSAKAVYDELSAKVSLSDYESDEEVVAESLNDLNARITSVESNKQDTISDIETIRSNAAAGAAKVSNVQSDWNAASGDAQILNKPNLATVATSGDYDDLLNKPTIPSAVTESTVSDWGFTKNTGTYSKPSGGIPKTDLASAVQTSLDKADTALQSYTETDPVFSASAAAGISSNDISNWNNKVSNVQSDWNATSGNATILNKPDIVTDKISNFEYLNIGTGTNTISTSINAHGYVYISDGKNSISLDGSGDNGINITANDGVDGIIDLTASNNIYLNTSGTNKAYYNNKEIATKNDIPSVVTESTVSGWGFTKNAVTQVKVGTTAYNPSSGVVSLPAYPTSLPASDVSSWAKASSKPTYTASEVGAIATSARGTANGVAPLNASSKIDATYLPSYVDDVLEYSGISNFPSTGEAGKIYTDTSTNKIYRWSGSQYIEISPSAGVTVTNGTSALSWDTDVTVGTVNGVNITAKLPSNPNTWRGIQDNLTSSTNTTESLSAKQGYLLANGSARDDTKLPLTGGTITGTTTLTYGTNLVFVDSNGENHSLRSFASWPDSLAHYAPGNGWVRMWDSGNDGSNSGLDADLLDGQHGSYYAAASSIPTKVSQLTNDSGFITGITSSMVSTALGYTPANSASLSGYLPLTGGTISGTSGAPLNLNSTSNVETAITFQRNGTTKAWIGYADVQGAYLFNSARSNYLNYKDDGSLLFEGNTVWHAGNDGSGSELDADLLDGKHNGELSAISCVNLGTYGVEGSTVADCKTWLAQIFSDNALGVGYNCNVGSSYINNWNDDSASYDPSSVHSFIKIGGGYSGTGYGQWLLSSYGTSRIGYVGRTNNQWTDIKWIATTEDIPTSLPASDVYSWAKASSKPSYSWSEITDKPSVAVQGEPNNLVHTGNEVTFIPPNFSNDLWFNYRTSDYSLSGNVTGYYFGDGAGNELARIKSGDMYVNDTRLAKITEIPTNTNQLTNGAGFITGITKSMVTTALGYTPPTSDTNTTYAAGTGVTISGSNNAINVTYGSSANTACQGNDSRLSNARPASDVYAWAKASTKPSYDNSEIGLTTITATGGSSLTLIGGKIYRLINLTGSFQFILDVTDVRCEDNVCVSKQYHCIFSTGNTAPTINWPAIDIWYGGSAPVIEANKTYELDILYNATDVVAICVEVA